MYKHILFPLDIEDKYSTKEAFPSVIKIAESFNAKLTIMTVIPDYGTSFMREYFPKGWIKDLTSKAKIELNAVAEKYVPSTMEVNKIVETGAIYESIINSSKEIKADLIVMPANRTELREYLLGPNTAKVARHSEVSVLILRDYDE